MNPDSATFWEHVEALRQTLLRIIGVIFFCFTLSFIFYKPLLNHLIHPTTPPLHVEEIRQKRLFNKHRETTYILNSTETLIEKSVNVVAVKPNIYRIPANESILISYTKSPSLKIFGPLEGMASTLKITFYTAIALTSPIWLYLILAFIAPALESPKHLLRFWILATTLFFCGLSFAWMLTIPCANHFLSEFNSEIGDNFWGLSQYIDYTLILLLANGIAFSSASVLAFLVHFGKITANHLRARRRHAIVAIFIISAILTPPDVFTQFLLAIPLMGLYEAVIFYARMRTPYGRAHLANLSKDPLPGQTPPKGL